MKTEVHHFDEGWVELTVEDDDTIHCVECDAHMDCTLAELDGGGSAPVCRECAGIPF